MLYKYIPNHFIATGINWISFNSKWEFNTTAKWQETVLEEIGATKVVVKKPKKVEES